MNFFLKKKNVEGTGSNLENNRIFVPSNEQHTQQKQLTSGKVYLVHSLKRLVHRGCDCVSEQMIHIPSTRRQSSAGTTGRNNLQRPGPTDLFC